jgi:hypothetical protein
MHYIRKFNGVSDGTHPATFIMSCAGSGDDGSDGID